MTRYVLFAPSRTRTVILQRVAVRQHTGHVDDHQHHWRNCKTPNRRVPSGTFTRAARGSDGYGCGESLSEFGGDVMCGVAPYDHQWNDSVRMLTAAVLAIKYEPHLPGVNP